MNTLSPLGSCWGLVVGFACLFFGTPLAAQDVVIHPEAAITIAADEAPADPRAHRPAWAIATLEGGRVSLRYAFDQHKFIEQEYTVQVPQMKVDAEGNKVVQMQAEQRTRIVTTRTALKGQRIGWNPTDLQFRDLAGKPIAWEVAKERLAQPLPVAVLTREENLDPFFVAILAPETLVVVTRRVPRP